MLPYLFSHILCSIPIFKDSIQQHEDQQGHIIHRCKISVANWIDFDNCISGNGDSVKILFFLCQVEISRRVTLEELPPVLVLHLKRFVYEKTGGCQKLIKNIEYPVDLEISKGEFCEQSSCLV